MPAMHEPSEVTIPPLGLGGQLALPQRGAGTIVFVHGSGSSRFSPRNRFVAEALRRDGFGTLLFDLLLPGEAADRRNVFDIPLLAGRLEQALDWLASQDGIAAVPVGLFGASTGAAAALVAAAEHPHRVRAIVSRGGRPDLAGKALECVQAPTLLVVGSLDPEVLSLNRAATARLGEHAELRVVEGAGHLFEEPGTLEAVVALAQAWFAAHL